MTRYETKWKPQNPQINDSDILAYSKYLAEYAQSIKKPMFHSDINSFFMWHLADEVIDGKTRSQWIESHVKQFAILSPGKYAIHYYPDGNYESNGYITVFHKCIVQEDTPVSVPWGNMERYVSVDYSYSLLEIEKMNLPWFSSQSYAVLE